MKVRRGGSRRNRVAALVFSGAAFGGGAAAIGALSASGLAAAAFADPPAPMALPTKAVCRACDVRGGGHGLEAVVAHRIYNGETYFFCAEDCAAAFDADPLAYATPVFPRAAPAAQVRSLDDVSAAPVLLESLLGDVTLVDFWATWCKPCLKSMPEIQKLHDALSGRGFRALGVAIDEGGEEAAKKVREHVKKREITYPVMLDDEDAPAWAAFHVAAVPAMYLIDREGRVVMQWSGEVDFEEVEGAVKAALAANEDRGDGEAARGDGPASGGADEESGGADEE